MDCEKWREAISATFDGEDPGVDPRLVAAHLRRCPGCQAFAASVEQTHRHARVAIAEPIPDLSGRLTRLAALADRRGTWTIVRALLAVVAIEIIAFSLPALVLGDARDTSAHAARHLGAFAVAYGVGLLVVVVRPVRARTLLPVAAVLAGALLITAVVDLANGDAPLVGETLHLPEVVSVVLLWLLAVPTPRRVAGRRDRMLPSTPELRVVDDQRDAG